MEIPMDKILRMLPLPKYMIFDNAGTYLAIRWMTPNAIEMDAPTIARMVAVFRFTSSLLSLVTEHSQDSLDQPETSNFWFLNKKIPDVTF